MMMITRMMTTTTTMIHGMATAQGSMHHPNLLSSSSSSLMSAVHTRPTNEIPSNIMSSLSFSAAPHHPMTQATAVDGLPQQQQ